jgi:hypothetical protein
MRPILESHFDSIRAYVPEEARRVLDTNVERVREEISVEIDAFAKSLATEIETKLANEAKQLEDDFGSLKKKSADLLAQANTAAPNPAQLLALASQLDEEVKAFNAKWKGLGEKARQAVIGAARSAGIPIPG